MSVSRRCTLLVLVAVTAFARGCSGLSTPSGPKLWRESADASGAPELARINDLLADLAARLQPGLVYVRVQRAAGAKEEPSREEPSEPRRSTGSGFVIDPNGLIVTNAHVVESAGSIQVRLADGRRFPATVVGRDNRVDLALLKIEGAGSLTVLPLGDSNRLRVGELVLALGNPFGLEQSVSFGIVSRKGAPLTVAAPGFDGTRLESPRDLQRVVSSTPVGKRVRVVLLREGQETELEVTIGLYQEREASSVEAPRRTPRPAEPPKEAPK